MELSLITDASRPEGPSLNSYMCREPFTFETASGHSCVPSQQRLLSKELGGPKTWDIAASLSILMTANSAAPNGSLMVHPSHLSLGYQTLLWYGQSPPPIFQRITSAVTRSSGQLRVFGRLLSLRSGLTTTRPLKLTCPVPASGFLLDLGIYHQ